MRDLSLLIAAGCCLFSLTACGEESLPESKPGHKAQAPVVVQDSDKARPASVNQASGSIKLRVLPDNPKATDCLSVVVVGQPGRPGIRWRVNGQLLEGQSDSRLCGDFFKRGDLVTAEAGTNDVGGSVTVTIGNTPPMVTDISATPEQVATGQPITVVPVAADADGDLVDFSYQWLVNGEADPLLTEATLPGDTFSKGDSVQVLIVPNDFYEDGPTYESYAMVVPNAAPQIISQPPQEISSLNYIYQVAANDPDDSQFTYRLSEAPDQMTINETSGLVQWSLIDVPPGDYTIVIIVADPDGAEAAQGYTLTLAAPQ